MLYNQVDLNNEIRELHARIIAKRKEFDDGMKQDTEFAELRKVYIELKHLEKRLELCFQESNAQREE